MIKNYFNDVFIGGDPFTWVHGIQTLKKGRSTLVVDTAERESSFNFEVFSLLEVKLFKKILQNSLGFRNELDDFFSPHRLFIKTSNAEYAVGSEVRDNLRELLRKLPNLKTSRLTSLLDQNDESLSEDFYNELNRFYDWFIGNLNKSSPAHFEFEAIWMRELLNIIRHNLENVELENSGDWSIFKLIQTLSVVTEFQIKSSFALSEAAYWVLKLISPMYKMQNQLLTRFLKIKYQELGGEMIRSGIESWKFANNRVTHVLLDRPIGLICGDQFHYYDSFSHGNLAPSFTMPGCHFFQLNTQNTKMKGEEECDFITILDDQLGTSFPFEMLSVRKGRIWGLFPFTNLEGSKGDFYLNKFRQRFTDKIEDMMLKAKSPHYNWTTVENQLLISLTGSKPLKRIYATNEIKWLVDWEYTPSLKGVEYWGSHRFYHYKRLLHFLEYL